MHRRSLLKAGAASGLGWSAPAMLAGGGVATAGLGALAAALCGSARANEWPREAAATGVESAHHFWSRDRSVFARRAATGETLRVTYWRQGQLDAQAYRQLCWLARDVTFERALATRSSGGRSAKALDQFERSSELAGAAANLSPWTLMNPVVFDIQYAIGSWLEWFGMARAIEWTSAFRHPVTNALTEGAAKDSFHVRGGAIDARIPGVPTEQMGRFANWLSSGGVGIYVGKQFTHTDVGRLRTWRG